MYNDSMRRRRVAHEGLGFTDIRLQGSFDSWSSRRWAAGKAEGDAGGVTDGDGDAL